MLISGRQRPVEQWLQVLPLLLQEAPRIGRRFRLDDTAGAHEAVEPGSGGGNVIIDVVPA